MPLSDHLRAATRLLAAPTTALLDGALRELVAETLDARPVVRHAELEVVTGRLQAVRDQLAGVSAELAALRQALDAEAGHGELAAALGIDDTGASVAALEKHRGDLARSADRLVGALDVAADQIEALATRLVQLEAPAPRLA